MISTDFAPNESFDDAFTSLKVLLRPWVWKKNKAVTKVKNRLNLFFPKQAVFLFLTGRAALYYLLRSFNLPEDSEILVQAFTCKAVVLPIIHLKLKPVYIDIERDTFSMDIADLQDKKTSNAKVLILQYSFGLIPKNRDKILEYAKQNNLFVIEDFAHGFIHKPMLKFINNEALLLSFGRSKSISSVFGGAVVTKNKKIISYFEGIKGEIPYPSDLFILKLLLYKPLAVFIKATYNLFIGKILHKLLNTFNLLVPEITNKEKNGEYDYTFSRAYPSALAYLLLNQLKKINNIQKKRQTIADLYNHNFNIGYHLDNSPLRFPLLIDNRDKIINIAKKKNIYLGKWYDQVVAPKGSCPTAEEISNRIINLPTLINEKQAKQIIKFILKSHPETSSA